MDDSEQEAMSGTSGGLDTAAALQLFLGLLGRTHLGTQRLGVSP